VADESGARSQASALDTQPIATNPDGRAHFLESSRLLRTLSLGRWHLDAPARYAVVEDRTGPGCAMVVAAIGLFNKFSGPGPNEGNLLPLVASSPDLERYNVGLNEWCDSVGATRAVLDVPIESSNAVRGWHCLDGRPIDWRAACRLSYPNFVTEPVMTNPDDAYSVKCKPT
jgi:hypothetical protein